MSSWLNKTENGYFDKDSEWYHVLLDVADLMQNYAKHPNVDDAREYAARAISFVLNHQEREHPAPQPPETKEDEK